MNCRNNGVMEKREKEKRAVTHRIFTVYRQPTNTDGNLLLPKSSNFLITQITSLSSRRNIILYASYVKTGSTFIQLPKPEDHVQETAPLQRATARCYTGSFAL